MSQARRISHPHPITHSTLWNPNHINPRAPRLGASNIESTTAANSQVNAKTRAGRRGGRVIA